jgi:hypothetical protein
MKVKILEDKCFNVFATTMDFSTVFEVTNTEDRAVHISSSALLAAGGEFFHMCESYTFLLQEVEIVEE